MPHRAVLAPLMVTRDAEPMLKLGLGTAPLGSLLTSTPGEERAAEVIETAWAQGIRTFDTAPLYGHGEVERVLGEVLADKPRDQFVISTKVGRLVRRIRSKADRRQGGVAFDFSYDAVMRSLEQSLERLRLDKVDLVYIHDPDDHFDQAAREAVPAVQQVRSQGLVRAIGVGMNQTEQPEAFAQLAEFDHFLIAGRYTLLDQEAERSLFEVCRARGIGVVAGGVFNSGVLASPGEGATFDYAPAEEAVICKTYELAEFCSAYGVSLAAAAIHFPLRHPAVSSILLGARTAAEVRANTAMFLSRPPDSMWEGLAARGHIPAAPMPCDEA